MGVIREKTMTRGVLLFAFNNDKVDYYSMAVATAKRANKFLNLPVTVVTDKTTDLSKHTYQFDNVIIVEADRNNLNASNEVWINKGRFQAYTLSPYDETLLLDTDYLINSDKLLKPFELYDDFMCHNRTSFLMIPSHSQELISEHTYPTLWATVIYFKKTQKTKQIFECMEMIQKNYSHYTQLYNMTVGNYRNDFSLTIALRIVCGQTEDHLHYIPWNLVHVGKNTQVYKDTDTSYTVMYDNWQRGKIRKEYCTVSEMDFHMMNKENFMELVNE
jgi:hypothetical protein